MERIKGKSRKIRGPIKMLDRLDRLPDISLKDLFEFLRASRKKLKGESTKTEN